MNIRFNVGDKVVGFGLAELVGAAYAEVTEVQTPEQVAEMYPGDSVSSRSMRNTYTWGRIVLTIPGHKDVAGNPLGLALQVGHYEYRQLSLYVPPYSSAAAKGPWEYDEDDEVVQHVDGGIIAQIYCPTDSHSFDPETDEEYNAAIEEGIATGHMLAASRSFFDAVSAVMAKHDKDARAANFAACGCEYCEALRPVMEKAIGKGAAH